MTGNSIPWGIGAAHNNWIVMAGQTKRDPATQTDGRIEPERGQN